jgi:hypothetical protein
LNSILVIVVSSVTIMILGVLLMEYAQSSSLESMEQSLLSYPSYWPGRYDSIRQVLASNQFIAFGVFIVVIGGLLSSLGYTIYKIFFKYID